MLFIALNATDKEGNKSITGFFSEVERTESMHGSLQNTFNGLLLWLCMNERNQQDDGVLSALMLKATPATDRVKEVSELIMPLMMQVSENVANKQVIKFALTSLMDIVKTMNASILKQTTGMMMAI
jgi:hypothetical protein